MPAQIIVTIADDRAVSYAAKGDAHLLDATTCLGALDTAKLLIGQMVVAPQPAVKTAPAAALGLLR